MAQIPKGRLAKGQYKPICRDCAMYFLSTVFFILKKIPFDGSEIRRSPVDVVDMPLLAVGFFSSFSRMRSEGFPFIVGVWGWTCVRFVFLVSSSPRRRVVVASSSPRRRQLVNFSPLGGTFALRHTSYFQSMKSGGSLARNALFGGVKSQNGRSFSCFA